MNPSKLTYGNVATFWCHSATFTIGGIFEDGSDYLTAHFLFAFLRIAFGLGFNTHPHIFKIVPMNTNS